MRRILSIGVAVVFALISGMLTFSAGVSASEGENDNVIDEKFGQPIVVYGESLTEEQKEQVRRLLDVDDPSMVQEHIVTAEDLVNYINGDPNSNMYSSAKIIRKEDGHGLEVKIMNPEYITQVTKDMYANALLTAGIENAVVEVASPLKVTGHSALTGIYKAYHVEGESLNQDRMEVANEELSLATKLAEKEGMDQEKVSELLTQIKQAISEQNPASKEEVEQIIQEQLDKLNLELSPEDRELLINLFEKMRTINIDFDSVRSQLETLANDIRGRIEDVTGDTGFFQAIVNFFKKIIEWIASLF